MGCLLGSLLCECSKVRGMLLECVREDTRMGNY